jgi:hypothetical protein
MYLLPFTLNIKVHTDTKQQEKYNFLYLYIFFFMSIFREESEMMIHWIAASISRIEHTPSSS